MHLTVSRERHLNVDLRTFYNHGIMLDSCAITGQFVSHRQVSGRSRPFSIMISAANVISNMQFACLLSQFLWIQLRVRPLGQGPPRGKALRSCGARHLGLSRAAALCLSRGILCLPTATERVWLPSPSPCACRLWKVSLTGPPAASGGVRLQ